MAVDGEIHVFVMGHSDEMLRRVPSAAAFEAVDLRTVPIEPRFEGDTFAEARFLVSPAARDVTAPYVGFCSANYDRKFPHGPRLRTLPKLVPHLRPHEALAPALTDDLIVAADHSHPGMAAILQLVVEEFGLTVGRRPVPYANTFICGRQAWLHLLDGFRPMLDAVLDWYGTTPPFGYACPLRGHVSDTGYMRYTNKRHLGYLAERLTMLHFAAADDVEFVTPSALRLRASRVATALAHLRRTDRATGDQRNAANLPWAREYDDAPACPGCAELRV